MSGRTRDWLKFTSLVGIAFLFGLAFASALHLPAAGSAAEPPHLQLPAAAPAPIPAARSASDLSDAFVAISERVRPAVVFVSSERRETADVPQLPAPFQDMFPHARRPQIEQGSGSGFIVSPDGYILTNNHVVAGADKVTVKLYDKREFDNVRVVGTDPQTDVAVLKIDATDLPSVVFGNSDSTKIGEWVLAIGNPLGEEFAFTVTAGIVSAKGRGLAGLKQSEYSIQDFIQTDAAINPGNSGGPLVNVRGQVIGINAAIASETGFYSGYGFAIPSNLVKNVFDQIATSGHVERAVMGIAINPATEADAQAVGLKQIRGVRVEDFTDDRSPAKAAGIQQGDVITMVDGQPVDYVAQLQQRIGFKKPGETVEVTVMRAGGVQKTFSVRLTAQPTDSQPSQVASKARRNPLGVSSLRSAPLGITAEPLSPDDMQDVRLARAHEVGGGMVVTDVSPDSPAYQRLLTQSDNGGPDIILKVNGQPVRTNAEFRAAVAGAKKGDVLTLVVLNISQQSPRERVLRLRVE